MSPIWITPFIIVAGALQALGAVMSAQLRVSLTNPWLALTVLFTLNAFFFAGLFAVLPRPLPTIDGISAMPWWGAAGWTHRRGCGLRRPRPHRQDRGRTGQWADYHGESPPLACHRPLRLDEHAGARPERWACHWWPSHGGRHYPRLSVLISRNAQETRG